MAKKKVAANTVKPEAPAIYQSETHPRINMHSSMITTKERFLSLWTGKAKGADLNKEWKAAEKWRSKYK